MKRLKLIVLAFLMCVCSSFLLVSTVSAANCEKYNFDVSSGDFTKSGNTYTSTNHTGDSKSSFTVTINEDMTFKFSYIISAEKNYDYLLVSFNNSETTYKYVDTNTTSTTTSYSSGAISYDLKAGTVITFSYIKDRSKNWGNDAVSVSIVSTRSYNNHKPGTAVVENMNDSTCAKTGSYDEVVYCTECKAELSRTNKEIAKKQHTPGKAVVENKNDSTCAKTGSYDEVVYCTGCKAELSRTNKEIAKKQHTPGKAVVENKNDSTCAKTGSYDEVVYCTGCKTELSRTNKEIAKKQHTPGSPVQENVNDSTCAKTGSYDEVKYCTTCKTELSRTNKEIAKKQHTPGKAVVENKNDSTCAKTGSYDEVVYCTGCKTVLSRTNKEIAKKQHTPGKAVVENKNDSTCAKTGSYDEVVYCTGCKTVLSRTNKEIAKKQHTSGSPVQENINDSTCEKTGSYDEVVYCTGCKTELSRTNKEIAKKQHTPAIAVQENIVEAGCTKAGSYDNVVYCSECHIELSRTNVSVPATGHAKKVLVNKVSSTIERTGYSGDYVCPKCLTILEKGTVVPTIDPNSINIENIEEYIDSGIKLNDEVIEELKKIADEELEDAVKIITAINSSSDKLKEKLDNGSITQQEYNKKKEVIQLLAETTITINGSKAEKLDEAKKNNNDIAKVSGIDLDNKINDFYTRTMEELLNIDIDNLEELEEAYAKAVDFVDTTIENMTNAAFMLRECSGTEVIQSVNNYISAIGYRSFKDFDKEAADAEFVQAAYQAILINMQQQVLVQLDAAFDEAKKSGKYVGTALTELENTYTEQRAAVEDVEEFEIMVLEIMRQKYISVLCNKLNDKLITDVEYQQGWLKAIDVDTFAPTYKEIFKCWALNVPSETEMTLEELTTATIQQATHNAVYIEGNKELTSGEITFLSIFGGSATIFAIVYIISKLVSKKRKVVA